MARMGHRHQCPFMRAMVGYTLLWSIYPEMANNWLFPTSVNCVLQVISRRIMIVDLLSILIPQLRLGLNVGATLAAEMQDSRVSA